MSASALRPIQEPLRRARFRDSDELAAAFDSWGMELKQLKPESDEAWTARGTFENLNVWSTLLAGGYRVRTGLPKGTVLLQLDLASARSRRLGSNTLAGDDILVGLAGAEIDGVLSGLHHGISFVIPQKLVTEALTLRAPDARAKALRPASAYVLSNCALPAAVLRRLAGPAFERPEPDGTQVFDSDAVLDQLLDALVEPWQRDTATTFRMPRSHCLPIVRRVEEYMRHTLGERIMLHDLCRVARASQRTVEYAFSTVYGVGPKQYLKLLRLNEIRRVLKSRPLVGASITEIAARHGMPHIGHFTADYRYLFGETPGSTSQLSVKASRS